MSATFSEEDRASVTKFLEELCCCSRCTLRFLGFQVTTDEDKYVDPEQYLELMIKRNDIESKEIGNDEHRQKKFKNNVCPVCLNCFDSDTIQKFITKFESVNLGDYKYNSFFFNVSFPKCMAIRAHGIYLALHKQFPHVSFGNLYSNEKGLPLEQPHKIFRCLVSDKLSKALNKTCSAKSNLSLLLILGYEDDNLEVDNIKLVNKSNKSSNKNKQPGISRNNIAGLLKDIDNEQFKKYFSVPPNLPKKEIFLEKIDVRADSIYVGGRYFKFQRNVGQTPWIIDGVSVSEHNVQDIIFDAVSEIFGCDKNSMTFTGSGREDVDVRMLGTGRPFYIKIDNPKEWQYSSLQLLEVEKKIIATKLVAVTKLQSIFSSDIGRIKFGEEHKKKTYLALCKTTAPSIKEVVKAINEQQEFKISQLTVIRVLHRRTLLSREKIIHKMKAREILEQPNLFELEIVTQAGTYVKEFVHGDFHRTEPSISSIIGYPTDLVALDCIDIDLCWPENEKKVK